MTASVPQDPNTQKVQKNAVYFDKTQYVNFRVSLEDPDPVSKSLGSLEYVMKDVISS